MTSLRLSSVLHVPFRRVSLWIVLLSISRAGWTSPDPVRAIDLEPALRQASLVLAARVVEVTETRMAIGGKAERPVQQFTFSPLQVLKGVFSRTTLALSSDDLGLYRFLDATPIKRGEIRLLILDRTAEGYGIENSCSTLDEALPPLVNGADPLLQAAAVLLRINAFRDREARVLSILSGLRVQSGLAALPLFAALDRRRLLAAQTPGAVDIVAKDLGSSEAAVRRRAADTLRHLLEADYLGQRPLRETAKEALSESLARPEANIDARAAALRAIGAAGSAPVDARLPPFHRFLEEPAAALAERSASLTAIGELGLSAEHGRILQLLRQLPLDASSNLEYSMEWSLAKLDSNEGLKQITARIKSKQAAGLGVRPEISVLGSLRTGAAASLLAEISKTQLGPDEWRAFVGSCRDLSEVLPSHAMAGLVPALANLIQSYSGVLQWSAVEVLEKVDSDDAARAVQPVLQREMDLFQKLQIAEFLGRHGISDGYPYAIEHMSDPRLREQAVAVLGAIRSPNSVSELRRILETSNDPEWNSAAVLALGRLRDRELAPRFLAMAGDFKNPLAPSALVALGDLGEPRALPIVRQALGSRSAQLMTAGARAAGKLLTLANVRAEDVRDQIASLLKDPKAPLEAREAAFQSLLSLADPRIDQAMALAVRDSGLEGTELLDQIEQTLRKRAVRLSLPSRGAQAEAKLPHTTQSVQ